MKMLYKYPQGEFPYQKLLEENRRRWGQVKAPEYELLDTGIFDQDRYFDVFIEYAKAGPEDIFVRIEAINRGPEAAESALAAAPLVPQHLGLDRSAGRRTFHPAAGRRKSDCPRRR